MSFLNKICMAAALVWVFAGSLRSARAEDSDGYLSLHDAMQLAIQTRDVERAQSVTESSRAKITQSFQPYIPGLRMITARELSSSTSELYLQGDLALFDRGRGVQSIRIARSENRAAELGEHQQILLSRLRAADLYFEASYLQSLQELYAGEVELLNHVNDRVDDLVRHAAFNRFQGRQFSRELLLTNQRLEDARIQMDQVRGDLQTLLKSRVRTLRVDPLPEYRLAPAWLTDVPASQIEALKHSPELDLLKERSTQYDAKLWLANADRLPSLSLVAQWGKLAYAPAISGAQHQIFASLEVPLPIFDAPFSIAATRRVVAEENRQLQLDAARAQETLLWDIETRLTQLQKLDRQLAKSKEMLKAAEADRREEEKNFLAGALDSYNFLITIQQTRDLRVAILSYRRSLAAHYMAVRLLTGLESFRE